MGGVVGRNMAHRRGWRPGTPLPQEVIRGDAASNVGAQENLGANLPDTGESTGVDFQGHGAERGGSHIVSVGEKPLDRQI